ncbi:MAG: class I SAM-dependent methyltransferase [Planctomycetaceae bacterium]|nr:class I SAM-dependent methyltransferase [Planctomycetaceae bacterium]
MSETLGANQTDAISPPQTLEPLHGKYARFPSTSSVGGSAKIALPGLPSFRPSPPLPMLYARDGEPVALQNMYRGGQAFLVCSGPSLASHDLSHLARRGVVTLAVNNAATVIRPQLWCCVDDPSHFCDVIWRDPSIFKFVPRPHFEKRFAVRNNAELLVTSREKVGDMPSVFGYQRNDDFQVERWLTEPTFNWGNRGDRKDAYGHKGSRSVMYVALRLAYYLGIRRLFLLGCDFRMENGKQNYAFEQARSAGSVRGNNSSYRILNERLSRLLPKFAEVGYEIWNCTPNSGLQVFPHCSYDEALDCVLADVPQKIVTRGMYDRADAADRVRAPREAPPAKAAAPSVPAQAKSVSVSTDTVTIAAVLDRSTGATLRSSWPSRRERLGAMSWLLFYDSSCDAKLLQFFKQDRRVRLIPRDRPLLSLLRQHAKTPWTLFVGARNVHEIEQIMAKVAEADGATVLHTVDDERKFLDDATLERLRAWWKVRRARPRKSALRQTPPPAVEATAFVRTAWLQQTVVDFAGRVADLPVARVLQFCAQQARVRIGRIRPDRNFRRSQLSPGSEQTVPASPSPSGKPLDHVNLDFTTIVGVDDEHLEEWRLTWPTWRKNRAALLERPLLVVCDAKHSEAEWRERLEFVDHPQKQLLLWDLPGVGQREKMLTGLVRAVETVKTPWFLKLDVDVVAEPHVQPIAEDWFKADAHGQAPVFVTAPWAYTKPAVWIDQLQNWATNIDELNAQPPLTFPRPSSSDKLFHTRIISYCFFGATSWAVQMSKLSTGARLPVPSHDTYFWYCAARRRDAYRTVSVSGHGWRHLPKRKLRPGSENAMLNLRLKRPAKFGENEHARTLVQLAESLRRPGERLRAAEIGVAQGHTSVMLLRSIADLELTMVDSWAAYDKDHPYRRSGDGCAALSAAQQNQRFAQVKSTTQFAADRRAIVRLDSLAGADAVPDGALDFAFIDADHTYDAVRSDIAAWWPKVRGGGVLAGHDYLGPRDRRGIWGVAKAVNEFAVTYGLTVDVGKGRVWMIRKPAPIKILTPAPAPPERCADYSDCGVFYLLTGTAHAARLVVSLASLRRHWSGPVTVYTTQDDSHQIGELCARDPRLNIEHRPWRMPVSGKNASYLGKVALAQELPHPRTLYLDCDTLVVGDVTPFFDALRTKPLCVAQFANWRTSGPIMRRRIERWRGVHSEDLPVEQRDALISAALRNRPAINAGIVAMRAGSAWTTEWQKLSLAGRRTFICDEIALQLLLTEQDHELLDCRFNCSPIYAQPTSDVRIWHFHGSKHLRHPQGRLIWEPHYERCAAENLASLGDWAARTDADIHRFLVSKSAKKPKMAKA